MRILALEPYLAHSHRMFVEGLQRHSRHEIQLRGLPARTWKWRMRTAALAFADAASEPWDLILGSDYLNLAELVAIAPDAPPAVMYFHENQLTYPLQGDERRDIQFAMTHLYSILASSLTCFNSQYHLDGFLLAVEDLLRQAPDVDPASPVSTARAKCRVLPLGVDVPGVKPRRVEGRVPVVLWNHRWEYDKNPDGFVEAMLALVETGLPFKVRLLGQRFRAKPPAFARLQTALGPRLEDLGYLPDRSDYVAAVASADIVVSTAFHEFFGLSTLEALRCGLLPVLPDDLAYPELLPLSVRGDRRFLYPREEGLAPALERALTAVVAGEWLDDRHALVRYTDRFAWSELAPAYDAVFEEAATRRSDPRAR